MHHTDVSEFLSQTDWKIIYQYQLLVLNVLTDKTDVPHLLPVMHSFQQHNNKPQL